MTADDVIRLLRLQPHPVEGGFFRETWRSADTLPVRGLSRSVGTAIYYLLKPGALSEMHRLPGDEVFHVYLGGPVRMLRLRPDGGGDEPTLGHDLEAGAVPQLVVTGGVWQGCSLVGDAPFALLGATMAPGFDYADYETGKRAELVAGWPAFAARIAELTPRG